MTFIQARNYTRADRDHVRLVVIHTMENAEKPGTALAVARWFASAGAPQASAHVCVDNRDIVECVRAQDVAWGAPKANRDGYHIEHAGRAAQSDADWSDDYSSRMLELSAGHAATIARTYGIPVRRLTPEQIAAGAAGFCGHVDVTRAYKTPGGHVDPGPAFPWGRYLAMVQSALEEGQADV